MARRQEEVLIKPEVILRTETGETEKEKADRNLTSSRGFVDLNIYNFFKADIVLFQVEDEHFWGRKCKTKWRRLGKAGLARL